MKVLQINLAYKNGSTGKIVYDIQKELMTQGSQGYVVYCHGKYRSKYVKPVKNKLTFYLSVIESRLGGSAGFYDKHSTKKVLKWILLFRFFKFGYFTKVQLSVILLKYMT